MTTRIVLCRHTQTDENRLGIYSGQGNVMPNTTGENQAHKLAARVIQTYGPTGITAILSSDLGRTAYLALLIGVAIGVQPVFSADLREVHIGAMTGLTKPVAMKLYPQDRYRTARPDFDFRDIGGETAQQVLERQLNFLTSQIAALGDRDAVVVVVGHGSALRLLFRDYLGRIENLHEQGDFQEIIW